MVWSNVFTVPSAALMSHCNNSSWGTQLSHVLLRLGTTPKDALDVLADEIVYGDPLVIPAKVFPSAASSDNLQCLRYVVRKSTPCLQTWKPTAKQHILIDLHSATHVFLFNNASKPPLMPPYKGPFLVISRTPKVLLLKLRGKEDWDSIDHLKLAYLLPYDLPKARVSIAGHPISHPAHSYICLYRSV
ncbi:uncharacterized protein [Palaemon carinicauda]|uniref:uncharacterized protein n=1 Tax=Palaemon carinicauda TaxID=392227 RepID=UPI0035B6878F